MSEMKFKRGQEVEVVSDWSSVLPHAVRKGERGIVADVIVEAGAYRVKFPRGDVYCNNNDLIAVDDAGRALVESAADAGVTSACTHTADGSVCAECLGAAVDNQQAAEIERLQASNAELRACADEAQAARLAAVAEAAAMRRAIETWRTIGTDDDHYSHDELEVIIDDLAKSVNGNAGAALLERLAKLEAALAFYRHPHWDGWNYISPDDGSAAADALKGDE